MALLKYSLLNPPYQGDSPVAVAVKDVEDPLHEEGLIKTKHTIDLKEKTVLYASFSHVVVRHDPDKVLQREVLPPPLELALEDRLEAGHLVAAELVSVAM